MEDLVGISLGLPPGILHGYQKKKKKTNTDRRVAEMKKKLIKEMKGLKTNLLFFNEKQKDLTMLYHQESVLKVIARILHHYTTRSF